MVKKIESDIFTFHDCSVSHVQTIFSQSFSFFPFKKKKHLTGNLSFYESGLKICFVQTFIPLQHSPLYFIFISISFSVFLFIACEILPFGSNNFFFCSLDFGIAACAPLDVDQTVWTGDIITS